MITGDGDKKKNLKQKTFVVGKAAAPSVKSGSRPNSGSNAPLPAIGSSSIAAYTKLKNAGLLKGAVVKKTGTNKL